MLGCAAGREVATGGGCRETVVDGVVGVCSLGGCGRCKGRKQTPAVSRKEMHYCSRVWVGEQAHWRQVQPLQETEPVR